MNLTVTELIDSSVLFNETAGYDLKKRQKGTRVSLKVKEVFELDESTGKTQY